MFLLIIGVLVLMGQIPLTRKGASLSVASRHPGGSRPLTGDGSPITFLG